MAESRPYNEKVDVYSYGVVLWEMTTLKKPFDGMDRDRFFAEVVRGSHRPPINKKWPKPWTDLMQVMPLGGLLICKVGLPFSSGRPGRSGWHVSAL